MPSHPDRVRRNYDEAPVWRSPSDTAAEQLERRSVFVTRCTCLVIAGGYRIPTTAGCPLHPVGQPLTNVATGHV
jgi:hypothetical protein